MMPAVLDAAAAVLTSAQGGSHFVVEFGWVRLANCRRSVRLALRAVLSQLGAVRVLLAAAEMLEQLQGVN